jgi:hypothetical protein
MKENWQLHWKDYYQILQVHPAAEPEVIEAVYKKLANLNHPDLNNSPEASQRMKDINEAHDILSNPGKKEVYHLEWSKKNDIHSPVTNSRTASNSDPVPKPGPPPKIPPKPVIAPQYIKFSNVAQGETKRASFTINNVGGSFSRVLLGKPPSWMKIVRWTSLKPPHKIPMIVDISAYAQSWGKDKEFLYTIKLDDVPASVKIELHSKPNPNPLPKPKVEPELIKFSGVKPGEVRKGSFIVRNDGGTYNKFSLSTPDNWIKISEHAPKYNSPLKKVDFEVNAPDWGKEYEGRIIVMLDDKVAFVKVEFQTQIAYS